MPFHSPYFRFCLAFFLWSLASLSLAEGDAEKTEPRPKETPAAEAPVPAENIDLKEVVSEPLTVKTPKPVPTPEATPEPEVIEGLFSVDARTLVEEELAKGRDGSGSEAKRKAEKPSPETQPPLVLLNSEVAPGTSTRLAWSPSVSFMGIATPTAVLVVNGVKPGPTLCLTAAVHGDELNGIEIVRRVLYNTNPEELSGAVIGVPIVNMAGFRRSSRYLPDRRDLNRFFPGNRRGSSAARTAHSFFSEVIEHCDYLIDLHTGSFKRTNLPQLRADLRDAEVKKLARSMGGIVVVQSGGAKGSLRRAAVEFGIPAVTLEAGAPHELQRDSVDHGVKSVETAMDTLKMVNRRRFWERPIEPIYYQSSWVRTREGGILFSEVELGATVDKGDVLGTVTDPITNERSEIRAPFEGRVIGMALNQVMFPGFAAYHLGLKASAEEAAETAESEALDDVAKSDAAAESEVSDELPAELPTEASAADVVPVEDVPEGSTVIEDSE